MVDEKNPLANVQEESIDAMLDQFERTQVQPASEPTALDKTTQLDLEAVTRLTLDKDASASVMSGDIAVAETAIKTAAAPEEELSDEDIIIEDEEEGEFIDADIVEENEDDEGEALSDEDIIMEEAEEKPEALSFERNWAKGEWQESELSPLGEYVEKIDTANVKGEMHYTTLCERATRDDIEDMGVINTNNPDAIILTVGDGIGSSKEGAKAASLFQQEFSKLVLPDMSNLSDSERQILLADKLNEIRERINQVDGQITLSLAVLLKDAKGGSSLLSVNRGDSSIVLASGELGYYHEIGASSNLWRIFDVDYNFRQSPSKYLQNLAEKAGMSPRRMAEFQEAAAIMEKIKDAPELDDLDGGFEYHTLVDYILQGQNVLTDEEKKKLLAVIRSINKVSVGAFNDSNQVIKPEEIMITPLQAGVSYNLEIASDGNDDEISLVQKANALLRGDFADQAYLSEVNEAVNAEHKRLAEEESRNEDLTKRKADDATAIRVGIKG